MMSRSLQAGALLALVFGAGAVAGYGLTLRAHRTLPPGPPLPTESVSVYEPLGLTPDQHARLDSILTAAGPRTNRMMDSVQERLRSHFDSIEQSIRAVLDDDQLRRLDSLRTVGGLAAPGMKLRRPSSPGGS
jgi:hypothetical protein